MIPSTPTITVPVDLTNPGQFFACCGLLELASRIDHSSEACFADGRFLLRTSADDVLQRFFQCQVTVDTSYRPADSDNDGDGAADIVETDNPRRGRIFPMHLGEPFDLLLNWWTEKDAQEQKLKLWTAGQRVTDLLVGHYKTKKKVYTPSTREHLARVVAEYPQDWLRKAIPIKAPAAFSFDSRLSRNNALDLGHFSVEAFAFSPAADVLSLVGLQRCRPLTLEVWNRNRYCTWREFVPVLIAPLAVLGVVPQLVERCFEFPIKARDSQGRYKLFGHAQPTGSSYV